MFNNNNSMDRTPASDFDGNDFVEFASRAWNKFGQTFLQNSSSPGPTQSQHVHGFGAGHGHAPRQSFSDSTGMDWAPTSSDFQQQSFSNHGASGNDFGSMDLHDGLEMGHMASGQGSGVRRMVAQFENKEYVPPLPPRPIQNNSMNDQMGGNASMSSHFSDFNALAQSQQSHQSQLSQQSNRIASPIDSSAGDSYFGSFDFHSRMASASPTPMNFGSFYGSSRVSSPAAQATTPGVFGSLDEFVPNNRVQSPMAMSPMAPSPLGPTPMGHPQMNSNQGQSTPTIGGTPGFAIWRPGQTDDKPQAFGAQFQQPQPQQDQHQQQQSHSQAFDDLSQLGQDPFNTFMDSDGFFKPPLPVKPKPELDFQQHHRHQSQHVPEQPQSQPQPQSRSNTGTNSAGFFKPPVPTTPKPVMNAGSQFILELNPSAKAKGKAPAKPPRPRSPPPMQTMFSPEVKLETPVQTPSLEMPPPSDLMDQQGSISLRTQPGTRPSREQVPAEAWEQYKDTIRTLYLVDRKPLKEVMSIMAEQYGFQATPKMYKTRFSQWGFVKNNTEDEVKRLLSMKFQRDAEGKVSEFVRNGKVVNLGTYLKRKGVTEYDLVDFELPADLPSHIRCRTPTPPLAAGFLRSPELVRAQELVIGSTRKAFMHCRHFEVETNTQVGWPSTMVWGAVSSDMLLEANFYFEASDADQGGHFLMKAFTQLETDLKKLSPQGIQELLLGMVNRDPGVMTALCKYLAAYSSTNFERSHPLRQIFSCLYEVQQKHGASTVSEILWNSLPTIAEELEAIYGRRHPYVTRAWADLALFYDHADAERLEKLVMELKALQRQVEQRHGHRSVDALALRFAILQLLYKANSQSDATKQAASEFWSEMRNMNTVFNVRDSRPNVYCYHSPLKVDPWTKRCRRRYDSLASILEEHVGVKVHTYFEEDFHMIEHAPDAQDSWAAAMQQMPTKWGLI